MFFSFKHPDSLCFIVLLLAQFLFGLSVCLVFPPYEGIDETAHFSRLLDEALSPSGKLEKEVMPVHHIATEVYEYYRRSPMPSMWISTEVLHKFDPLQGGFHTYAEFFGSEPLQRIYRDHKDEKLPLQFHPGPEENWEYQHPPLYYVLLAPLVRVLSGHATLQQGLILLRVVSYSLAFLGFLIGWGASFQYLKEKMPKQAFSIGLIGILYPFYFPVYFFEFGRVGNDSLCLFVFSLYWALQLYLLKDTKNDVGLFLGILLGINALVKATMLPVGFGAVLFNVLRDYSIRKERGAHYWWFRSLRLLGAFCLVGIPSYLINTLAYHNFGAAEFSYLLQHKMTLTVHGAKLIRVFLTHVNEILWTASFAYGGWSGIVYSSIFFKIFFYCLLVTISLYGIFIARHKTLLAWLPVFSLGPLWLGLVFHMVTGTFTPGWYLHSLAPALSLVCGLAFSGMMNTPRSRIVFASVMAPIFLLDCFIVTSYMTYFGGCLIPHASLDPHLVALQFDADQALTCFTKYSSLMDSLSLLSYPTLSLCMLLLSLLMLFLGLGIFIKLDRVPNIPILHLRKGSQ